jgi:hypothetical protein
MVRKMSHDYWHRGLSGDTILVERNSFVESDLSGEGDGAAGSVTLTSVGDLTVRDSAVDASNFGIGDSGEVTLKSGGTLTVEGRSLVGATTERGNAGQVRLEGATVDIDIDSSASSPEAGFFFGNVPRPVDLLM